MMQTRRTFASRYRTPPIFAPGPGLFFVPLIILPGIALFRSFAVALMFTIGAIAIWVPSWRSMRQRAAALLLQPEGVKLEGFSFQPWAQIEGIRPLTDERGRPAIEMRIKGLVPRVPRSPLWRASSEHTIVIFASLLEDPPAEIEDAFEYFLTGAGRQPASRSAPRRPGG